MREVRTVIVPDWSRRPFTSAGKVGMKGKSKGRAKDRDLWSLEESDDDYVPSGSRSLGASWTPGEERGGSFMQMAKKDHVKARNPNQERYARLLEADHPSVVIAVGPAGTGKTLMAVHAGIRKLQSGKVGKLVITRPAVCAEEELGFLPGTMEAKMLPHLLPIYDVFHKYYSPNDVDKMMAKGTIEICPFAYMRGRTFEHAYIIADETQNCTKSQVLMLLTRIGHGSKLVLTGDPAQHDRGYEVNGLQDFMHRFDQSIAAAKARQEAHWQIVAAAELARGAGEEVGALGALGATVEDEHITHRDVQMVRFTDADVERHPVIKKILKLYP